MVAVRWLGRTVVPITRTALLVLALGTVGVSQEGVAVEDILDKSRAELTHVFPGTSYEVRDWRGWRTVLLVPDRAGRVVSLVLVPSSPVTEEYAAAALRRLGVSVGAGRHFASQTERGYSDMDGAIRTVIYSLEGDDLVSRIGIFSKLADDR